MSRPRGTTIVVLAALSLALSACGGGSTSEGAASEPTDSPTASAPTAEPTATPRPRPTQPEGEFGVTIDIQNFEDYATNPAVLAWKKTFEAVGASGNRGKLVPGIRDLVTKSGLRAYLPGINAQWDNDYVVTSTGQAKVQSARTSGRTAKLVVCAWEPTTDFRTKTGEGVEKLEEKWNRQFITVTRTGGVWKVSGASQKGACGGGPPA